MTPSFVGAEVTQAYAEATTAALAAEAGRTVGDAQLAILWLESTTITPTTPEGWTLLGSVAGPGGPFKVWIFGRICDGTAKDNFVSTFTKVSCEAGMRRISGAAPVADWLLGATTSTNAVEGKIKPVATTATDSFAVGVWNTYNGMTSPPSGSTAGWTREGSVMLTLTKAITGVESTGEPAVTWASSQNFVSMMVVIPPGEAAPTGTGRHMSIGEKLVEVQGSMWIGGKWVPVSGQGPTPALEYDFEDGTLNGFNLSGVGEGPIEPVVSTEIAHSGTHAVVVDMPAGSTQNRAELMVGGDGDTAATPTKFYEGDRGLYSLRHYLFPGEMAYGLPGAHNIFTQLKSSGEGSPEAALELWNWEYPSGSGIFKKGLWVAAADANVFVAPYAEGAWHLPQVEFVASEKEAGMFKVTLDGDVVYEATGINTIIPGHEFLYLKFGNYRNGLKVSTAEKPVFDKGDGGPCHDAFDDFRLVTA